MQIYVHVHTYAWQLIDNKQGSMHTVQPRQRKHVQFKCEVVYVYVMCIEVVKYM